MSDSGPPPKSYKMTVTFFEWAYAVLCAMLVLLRLSGLTHAPWWLVLAPTWAPWAMVGLVLVGLVVCGILLVGAKLIIGLPRTLMRQIVKSVRG